MTVSLAARWHGGFRPRRIFWCCVRAQREIQIHRWGSQQAFAAICANGSLPEIIHQGSTEIAGGAKWRSTTHSYYCYEQ